MSKNQEQQQKDFFNLIFADKPQNQYITIVAKSKDEVITQKHFKSIRRALDYANKVKYYQDVYFSLGVTDGEGRATENIVSRNIIAFDFDKKDLGAEFNYKDINQLGQKNGIYFHALIDSGNGFHAYVLVERAEELQKLLDTNKVLAEKLGADSQAVSPTQILRIPFTFNHKNEKKKPVNTVYIADKIIENNLDKLHQRLVYNTNLDSTNLKYLATGKLPPCIEGLLAGVEEGERDFFLGRLTTYLKKTNYGKSKAQSLVQEWNERNNPPLNKGTLEYHFDYYWDKDYKLSGCSCDDDGIQELINRYCDKYSCNKKDQYERVYTTKLVEVEYEYKLLEKIKPKGSGKVLSGNHLAVIGILKNKGELDSNTLQKKLVSIITGKACMSKPTYLKVMSELEEMGLIEVKKGKGTIPNKYKIKNIKHLESEKLVISYHATQRFVDGAIGSSAFRIYCYLVYRHKRMGNVVQTNIADDLGITQTVVSKAITELERADFLSITKDYSVNPLGANMYRCNY